MLVTGVEDFAIEVYCHMVQRIGKDMMAWMDFEMGCDFPSIERQKTVASTRLNPGRTAGNVILLAREAR